VYEFVVESWPALIIMRLEVMQNNEAFYHKIYIYIYIYIFILKNFSTHGLCFLFNFLS
jgi:hypothetical protein